MPPPRAVYIAFDVFPRPKGSSSHIRAMLEALTNSFAPVIAICLGDPETPAVERQESLEIHRLSTAKYPDLLDRATAFAKLVEKILCEHRTSLERIVFRDPWGGFPAIRAFPHCPAFFEVNALPSWELPYSRPSLAASATFAAKLGDLERFCLRGAHRILCVSQVTRRALAADFGTDPGRIEVIPNSASDCFFAAAPAGPPCDFAYVGGLQPWQGVDRLIDSVSLLAPDLQSDLRIIHSGGPARAVRSLERRIVSHPAALRSRVTLEDPQPPEMLAATLAGLRFTVAPLTETPRNTWQGCCPIKIVESMAAGTPVIASDLEVTRELIRHGEDGFLVPPGDTRALAAAIQRLSHDTPFRNTLAEGAKRTAYERFSRSFALEQLCRVFGA